GLYAYGLVDQILHLKGNRNFIRNIDKEGGGTGASTDPYVLVERHNLGLGSSDGNVFDWILLEGTTSPNKSLIKLDGCNETWLDHLWLEPTLTDGYGIRINNCGGTHIGAVRGISITTKTKIKIDLSQNTQIDYLDIDAEDLPLSSLITVDAN